MTSLYLWSRTFSIVKEVSKGQVLLRIPFPTILVKELKVESWTFHPAGNELHLLLKREKGILDLEKPPFESYAVYPGELR
jgi:hypothetical protein